MGKIIELPPLERPKEKALRFGVSSLSDSELLAILINTGYQGVSAKEIGEDLLTKYHGLLGLVNANYVDLVEVKGIKKNKALTISTIIEIIKRVLVKQEEEIEYKNIKEYLINKYFKKLRSEKQEYLYLIIVNRYNKILKELEMYKGTDSNIIFSYHDAFRELFKNDAKGFYLIHNHPGEEANPSLKDRLMTNEVKRECKRIRIPLRDHLIIGENSYYSFQEMKKVDFYG